MRDCFYSSPGISPTLNLLQVQRHAGYHVVILVFCFEKQDIWRYVEKKPQEGFYLPGEGYLPVKLGLWLNRPCRV